MLNLIRASLGILPDSTFPENALDCGLVGCSYPGSQKTASSQDLNSMLNI